MLGITRGEHAKKQNQTIFLDRKGSQLHWNLGTGPAHLCFYLFVIFLLLFSLAFNNSPQKGGGPNKKGSSEYVGRAKCSPRHLTEPQGNETRLFCFSKKLALDGKGSLTKTSSPHHPKKGLQHSAQRHFQGVLFVLIYHCPGRIPGIFFLPLCFHRPDSATSAGIIFSDFPHQLDYIDDSTINQPASARRWTELRCEDSQLLLYFTFLFRSLHLFVHYIYRYIHPPNPPSSRPPTTTPFSLTNTN